MLSMLNLNFSTISMRLSTLLCIRNTVSRWKVCVRKSYEHRSALCAPP
jgi:hypothetical protein